MAGNNELQLDSSVPLSVSRDADDGGNAYKAI